MFRQPYAEKNLCHAIVCHFLVNDTAGGKLEKKMTKCDTDGKGRSKKSYFACDVLVE